MGRRRLVGGSRGRSPSRMGSRRLGGASRFLEHHEHRTADGNVKVHAHAPPIGRRFARHGRACARHRVPELHKTWLLTEDRRETRRLRALVGDEVDVGRATGPVNPVDPRAFAFLLDLEIGRQRVRIEEPLHVGARAQNGRAVAFKLRDLLRGLGRNRVDDGRERFCDRLQTPRRHARAGGVDVGEEERLVAHAGRQHDFAILDASAQEDLRGTEVVVVTRSEAVVQVLHAEEEVDRIPRVEQAVGGEASLRQHPRATCEVEVHRRGVFPPRHLGAVISPRAARVAGQFVRIDRHQHAMVADAREAVAERAVGARLEHRGRLLPVRAHRGERLALHRLHAVDVRRRRAVAQHEALAVLGTVRARHPELAHRDIGAALDHAGVAVVEVRTASFGA